MIDKNFQRTICLPEGEAILVNKPLKWTSFDVVNNIRNFFNSNFGIKKIKIGHAGTLDPLATGLLIICVGKYTKRIVDFQSLEKVYEGTFTLGATTPSFDMETKIDKSYETNHITKEMMNQATQNFIGEIQQIPPLFSAIKIKGKRAYNYARKKEDIKLAPRIVDIKEFNITNINLPKVDFFVRCSKGTYIRSLARDFGNELKSGAYLSTLCRTQIGEYKLENAFEIEQLKEFLKDVGIKNSLT